MITSRYNYEATRQGYPKRTWAAIKHKCDHLKLSRVCIGEWIKATALGKTLGVSASTVARWIHGGKLEARQFKVGKKGSAFYVKRVWLRKFARENPKLFGGLDRCTLYSLLDSEVLANEIAEASIPPNTIQVPVLCVETGKRFESLRHASEAVFISRWRITYAIKNPDKTAGGYHWQRL
jgi:hypothetical protein